MDRIVLLVQGFNRKLFLDLFRIHFCQSGFWFRTGSVPGLVLVVPSVEIVVEEDDASRRHAGNDAPEGPQHQMFCEAQSG